MSRSARRTSTASSVASPPMTAPQALRSKRALAEENAKLDKVSIMESYRYNRNLVRIAHSTIQSLSLARSLPASLAPSLAPSLPLVPTSLSTAT